MKRFKTSNITIHHTPQSNYRVEFINSDGVSTCWFAEKMTQSAITVFQQYAKDYDKVEVYFNFSRQWNFVSSFTTTKFVDVPVPVLGTHIHNCVHNIIWDTDNVETDIDALRQNYLLSMRRDRLLKEFSDKYDKIPTVSEKAIIDAYADFLTTQEW